ncbi:MAG: class I SAM-dependent methyltransferase, partial [Acidimicrobiia bacterium]
ASDRDLPGLKFRFLNDAIDSARKCVLETGCSGGRHLRSLQAVQSNRRYMGCDIDVQSLRQGKSESPGILFVAADGLMLPFKDGHFDAVYFMDYLEHVTDPRRTAEEMVRALKRGGILSAFVPCEGNRWTVYWVFTKVFGFNVKEPAAGHIQSFTDKQIIDLFRELGLEVTRVRYSYHLLGQLGDFFLFLMVYISKGVSALWWSDNKYYHQQSDRPRSLPARFFNTALTGANFFAYIESRLLHRVRFLSSAIHVNFVKP